MQKFLMTVDISADGEDVVGTITGIRGKKCHNIAALLAEIGKETVHRHTADYAKAQPVNIGTPVKGKLKVGR